MTFDLATLPAAAPVRLLHVADAHPAPLESTQRDAVGALESSPAVGSFHCLSFSADVSVGKLLCSSGFPRTRLKIDYSLKREFASSVLGIVDNATTERFARMKDEIEGYGPSETTTVGF